MIGFAANGVMVSRIGLEVDKRLQKDQQKRMA
jgi:hypothetical protein